MPLRIGQIEYANCVPLFRALRDYCNETRWDFVRGVPAQLNRMLEKGEIDLCPSSSIVYGTAPEKFWLMPGLSISATGPVKSVMLFSRVPLEELGGGLIGLTSESDTSVALLKIILARYLHINNTFHRTTLPLQDALKEFSALLLIGDKALRENINNPSCHIYDLGELWLRFTGLPFVFALWIVNRTAVDGLEQEVSELSAALLAAKEIARQNLVRYASEPGGLEWLTLSQREDYWRTISYDLGEDHLKGLTTFYSHAAELGIIKSSPKLEFFPLETADG
jgi:chorismate dehydratase